MVARDKSGNEAVNFSDTFTIIDGTPPHVSVLSPNGGEVWDLSSLHEIKWNASSPNGIQSITIYLYYADTAEFLAQETDNDGSYTWTLPISSHFVTDTAKIKIRAVDGNDNEAEDWSDGYFSVRDPSQPPPPPWTMPERVTTVPPEDLQYVLKDHSSPNLAADKNGDVHLVYMYTQDDRSGIMNKDGPRIFTQQILYKKLSESTWSDPEIVFSLTQETEGSTGAHHIQDLRIAVDSAGTPHIVWTQSQGGSGITSSNFGSVLI